ncbi:hypothetical protein [Nonomuraea bangladeshensis]|uniref:WXG100 family type VII secretion target n=1 Tax=Nonomuraea bangladeshensis TaxID=404385 RepID=UPI0031DC19BB
MSKREVVVILSFERMPQGEKPSQTGDQIKQLLGNTDPGTITGAGQTYMNASTKVDAAVSSLEEHAAKIAAVWKGPDAAKARHALEMLHASGRELSTKLSLMGGALQNYAERLAETKSKVNEPVLTDRVTKTALEVERAETLQAQKALHELNQEIVNLYNIQVPHDVSYELPTVTLQSPINPQTVNYPTGSGSNGPTLGSGNGGSTGSGSFGSGSTSTNPGGTDPNGSNPNGSNPNGSNPNGSNPNGSDPNGSNPNGSNPNGSDPNGSNPNGSDPNGANPGQTQNPGTNPGTNPGDGTVPPVIGNEDRTSTDGSSVTDPRRTDMASFQPQATPTLNPTTLTPSFTGTTPGAITTITPPPSIGYTPGGITPGGVPSVIGSPGLIAGQSPMAAAGLRGAGGAAGGMPLMPLTGGGAGGGEGNDLERSTFLSEDPNCWTTAHDTTDPVIG